MNASDVETDVDLVAQHGPFLLTKTGAVPTGEPTYSEWEAAILWVQEVEKASLFWVGDLMLFGERFGEASSQVLDATQYAEQTCWNAKCTAKAIPPERRRPNVSFAHHSEVAQLAPVEQDKWLARCEDQQLTREQLRVHLKAEKATAEGHPVEFWLQVRCMDLEDQQMLADHLKLQGRVVHLQTKES